MNKAFVLRTIVLSMLVTARVCVAGETSISSISCIRTNRAVSLSILADQPITSYQKPEKTPQGFVIRIPDATLRVDAIQQHCDSTDITLTAEKIRTFAVLRCATKYDSVQLIRKGPKELLATFMWRDGVITGKSKAPAAALDVIVIDAGHGGEDAGAVGVNGVYEKDVTLAIALELRKLITTNMPKTKVVMTRSTDIFVPLASRTQIANDAKGSIFVSIHCNSMPTKPHPAHGCETYILRPGRNDDAARVAARENASLAFEHKGSPTTIPEEQLIVATLAQRSFVRFSELLAKSIQAHVGTATGLQNRGISQAGFYVLVGASMPNVLFETAFLSNEEDASYVSSVAGRQRIALSMFNAIKAYARTYSSQIKQ